ncbi:MAG: response regulator [Neisseria sp.]|nr:response regulator [Neisseria sp.]
MYDLMIVDDSNIVRNLIKRHCHADQFKLVATANNGEDAVLKYQAYRPDIVTMDLTMPRMDGFECIRNLRRIDPYANILVISALSDELSGLQAIALGARGFLPKPFTDKQLDQALHMVTQQLMMNRNAQRCTAA